MLKLDGNPEPGTRKSKFQLQLEIESKFGKYRSIFFKHSIFRKNEHDFCFDLYSNNKGELILL